MTDPQARDTHVFKVVDGCEIRLDVFGAHPGARKPCVVWIHGGGLVFNSRLTSPRPSLVAAMQRQGLVVVSIDHRLAPETKLPDIVDDVRDAWRWIREVGPKRFGIDAARIGMAGSSAGGYLSLIGGYTLTPRPRALASFWGFGDITAPWEAEPSEFYRRMELVTRERADRSVGTVAVSEPPPDSDRDWFYLFCRQQGRWLIEVTGHDLRDDPAWFEPYCPLRRVTADYPPTMLVHGTRDDDVPHRESENLARRFAELGVKHEFVSLEGVGHGFAGARPEDVARVEALVASFMEENLR